MASILNATTSSGLVTSADNSGSLQLATNNGTTAVTIDTSQRVLIGATSASGFDSGADNLIVGAGSGSNGITIYSGNTSTAAINFADGTTGSEIYAGGITYNHNTNNLDFSTTDGSGRMRIDSSGNAYIGKTSASSSTAGYEFNVGGSAYSVMTNTRTDSLGDLFILNRQGSNGTLVNFFTANSSRGTISYNGSVIVYGGSSDYRLKENIQPMTGALAKVSQLKPVTYTWKSNGKNGEGFIAHELQEIVPDCVAGEKDAVDAEGNPQYQNVDPRFLVATLTAAIQELKAELDATKAEVQALKGTL